MVKKSEIFERLFIYTLWLEHPVRLLTFEEYLVQYQNKKG